MPSFQTVLRRISSLWSSNQVDLKMKGSEIMSRLEEAVGESVGVSQKKGGDVSSQSEVAARAVMTCKDGLAGRFDARLGGFGGAPKFPRPCEIDLLLHANLLYKVRLGVLLEISLKMTLCQ
jgi:uncharacterized protein YyaL (SSP411 family)